MLKLNASYSKKVPAEGEYSSQSYHASIEVELPDGLSQEQLNSKIHDTFAMVRNSVEAELHGTQQQETSPRGDNSVPSTSAVNNGHSAGVPASPKQISYLLSLASRRGISPQQIANQHNVASLEQLTKRQVSALIEQWKARKMEQHDTPHWSYSSLNCFLQCPLKYAFRYIEHAPVERTGVCLPFGRAFHAVLSERAIKGSAFQLEDAQEDFAVYFKGETDVSENLCYKSDESYDGCLNKGFEMLAVALEHWQDDFVVKAVAEPFSVTIPDLHKPLIGEFDLIVTDGGDQAVVDWKTSASQWPAGKADRELQATAYCYAYRERYGINPIFRYDVVTKTKQPAIGSWYTVRTADELERFVRLAIRIERAVESGNFYPNESVMNCAECPYRDRCKKWR